VTLRKKKILGIQIFIFLVSVLILYSTYFYKNEPVEILVKKDEKVKKQTDIVEDNKSSFEDVEYKGIDLNGNRYVLRSESADFDLDKPELINMKIMTAFFYFKDGTVLKVEGDYGSYNNKTKDMQFRDNIVALYLTHILYSDNLDFMNSKNLLTIYGNVKTESVQGNVEADNMIFDLTKQTLDISMFSEKRINVNLKE
jgi:hypothetical protein|tara:strand:- start:556 stop:1149 length:594 start_codon:yes stop_codon:yes gene_type:complete